MADRRAANDELLLASRDHRRGLRQTDLSVPTSIAAAACRRSKRRSARLPGVEQARVNLSARRVTIRWRADGTPPPLIETLNSGSGTTRTCHDADCRLEGRHTGETDPRACGRRLRGQQHHAAVGLGLVRRGAGNPRPVSLDFGADRASRRCLFGPHILLARPGEACAMARPTWTFRFPSACCSPSA